MLSLRRGITTGFCKAKPLCIPEKKWVGYSSHELAKGAEDAVVGDPDDQTDVSRLPKNLRQRMEKYAGPLTFNEDAFPQGHTRTYLRRWYARHGQKTGIDPRIAYPTKEELREMIKEENEFEPTLQERWAIVGAQKSEEAEKRRLHEERVRSQMAKMPQFIAQYKKKLIKGQEELKKLEEKKKALLEEARDYYGYKIDEKDPRFHQLQEKKEAEELAEKKKRKKEEKKAKAAEALRKLMSK